MNLQGFGTEASQDCATLTSPKLSLNLFYSAVVTTVSLIYLWLFFFPLVYPCVVQAMLYINSNIAVILPRMRYL